MNVEQLLRSKFRDVKRGRGKNGTEYKVNCPKCGGKFKLYINPTYKDGVFNCYKCAHSGPLRQLIGEFISNDAPVAAPVNAPLPDNVVSPGNTVPLEGLGSNNPAIQYLTHTRKRAFDPTYLSREYGARYCYDGKEFFAGGSVFNTTNTLIFPVWMMGNLVGWQSRLLYDPDSLSDDQCAALGFPKDGDGKHPKPPKYLTNPGLSKGRVLWNFDMARRYKFVVPSEGVFDAASIGHPGVCTFGTGISDDQARLLKDYWEAVIIMLDPDGTEAQVQKLVGNLRRAVLTVPVRLSGGYKDPGDTPTEEIWRQIVAEIDNQIRVKNTLALQDLRNTITGVR